jgi:hypothetical protein
VLGPRPARPLPPAQVKLLKCLIDNIVVDISYAQIGGLCTLNFLEEIDRRVGKDHLFKRSIILVSGAPAGRARGAAAGALRAPGIAAGSSCRPRIGAHADGRCPLPLQVKAWCYYESRLLGAHHGLISTYALETLVLYIFNVYHTTLNSALEVRCAADGRSCGRA